MHRVTVFYVRPCIFRLHREAGFGCIPGYCACTGTQILGASGDITRGQRRCNWGRSCILCVRKDAVFGCVPECFACRGTPILSASLDNASSQGRKFWDGPWRLCVNRNAVYRVHLCRLGVQRKPFIQLSVEIVRAEDAIFPFVPGDSACTGTPFSVVHGDCVCKGTPFF